MRLLKKKRKGGGGEYPLFFLHYYLYMGKSNCTISQDYCMKTSIHDSSCRICGEKTVTLDITNETVDYYGKTLEFRQCSKCHFIACPTNRREYKTPLDFGSSPRIGKEDQIGREGRMIQGALEILEGSNLDVLIFGAGISEDYKHAQKYSRIRSLSITDLDNFTNSDAFIPLHSDKQFDLVICSEVIEHFENPSDDFLTLFNFVKHSGLIICSTNVNDMKLSLEHTLYPFIPGHTSYYSGLSLMTLAKKHGFFCDFRFPRIGLFEGGPRKRYIYFFKEPKLQENISLAFSKTPLALSE